MPTLRKTERGWMRHQNSSPDFTAAIVRPRLRHVNRMDSCTKLDSGSGIQQISTLPIVHVAYLTILEKKVGRRNCFRGKLLGASFTLAFRVLLRLLGLPSFCAEPALLRTVLLPLLTPLGLATCSVRSSPVAASENQCKCFQR